jgi:hypothetical protein
MGDARIEDHRYINTYRYEVVKVLKRLKRAKEFAVEFCDRCAKLCDAGCRATAIRERALSLRLEVRF